MQHTTAESYTNLRDIAAALFQRIKGYPLDNWLKDQRDLGYTFRQMADRLEDLTDGEVAVSYRTLARWVDQLEKESV